MPQAENSISNIQRLKKEYESRQQLIALAEPIKAKRVVRPPRKKLCPKAWYRQYLASAHWKAFRLSVIAQRGTHCELCKALNIKPEVHHLNYQCVGREVESDVIVLCGDCHRLSHDQPTTAQLRERFALKEGITSCHTPKWMRENNPAKCHTIHDLIRCIA